MKRARAGRGGAGGERLVAGQGRGCAGAMAMADAGLLMQCYEGSARGRGVETAGWRLCLAHRFPEQRQPFGAGDVPFGDVLRHVGMMLRYGQGHRRRARGREVRWGWDAAGGAAMG